MSRSSALQPATHPSPWIDDDGDVLVSTASTSSESDVIIDSSNNSTSGEETPRLQSRSVPAVATTTLSLPTDVTHTLPTLRSPYELPELPHDPIDDAPASPSPTALASATASPSSPRSNPKFRPASVQLAPLLANLINVQHNYLQRLGLDAGSIVRLIDIVSALPFGLRGNVCVGSVACAEGLRQATKRLVSAEEAKGFTEALARFLADLPITKEPGRLITNRLISEIYRALTNDRRYSVKKTFDATLGGKASWLHGPHRENPRSVASALHHALQSGEAPLEKILGEKAVAHLKRLAESLPADFDTSCEDSPEKYSLELKNAISQSEDAKRMGAILAKAAMRVGTDPNGWDTLIRYAMRSEEKRDTKSGEEESSAASPEEDTEAAYETRAACISVFKLLGAL